MNVAFILFSLDFQILKLDFQILIPKTDFRMFFSKHTLMHPAFGPYRTIIDKELAPFVYAKFDNFRTKIS